MSASATLFTKLDPQLHQALKQWSAEKHTTQRAILEEALQLYAKEERRRAIAASYQAMATDTEYLEEMVTNTSYLGTV